jgi:hypothetical protein
MSQHPVCCLAPSQRWPSANADTARAVIIIDRCAEPMTGSSAANLTHSRVTSPLAQLLGNAPT